MDSEEKRKLFTKPLGRDLKNLALAELDKHEEYGKTVTRLTFPYEGSEHEVVLIIRNKEADIDDDVDSELDREIKQNTLGGRADAST